MNNIITLPKLTESLSIAASVDIHTAQIFVADFTSLVIEALKIEDNVNIKGFGSFNKIVSDNKIKVEFVPDREIAKAINAPFISFEPVELASSLPIETLNNVGKKQAESDLSSTSESIADDEEMTTSLHADLHAEDSSKNSTSGVIECRNEDHGVVNTSESAPIEAPVSTPPEDISDNDASPETIDENENSDESSIESGNSDNINTANNCNSDTSNSNISTPSAPTAPAESYDGQSESADNDSWPSTTSVRQTPKFDVADDDADDDTDDSAMRFSWFTISLFFVVGLLTGLGLGYFGHDYIQGRAAKSAIEIASADEQPIDISNTTDTIKTAPDVDLSDAIEDVVEKDIPNHQKSELSAPAADTSETPAPSAKEETVGVKQDAPAAAAVYDVVSPGGDLISLALKHYKKKDYWVYIYEANKDKIKNPNNVRSGIRLVIPPKSQCDVSSDDAKNTQAAKEKAAKVLSQF